MASEHFCNFCANDAHRKNGTQTHGSQLPMLPMLALLSMQLQRGQQRATETETI